MRNKKALRGVACFIGFWVASLAAIGIVSAAAQAPPVALKSDLTIGVEDGDEDLMFGLITRVDLDGNGKIYILDNKLRKVVVCRPDGSHLRTIAVPAGQGPQEATQLGGIAVTPTGTLYINAMRKVIVYGPDGEYLRTFIVDFMISSIGCPGTEDLVAIGPNGGKILHVFDQTGKLLASLPIFWAGSTSRRKKIFPGSSATRREKLRSGCPPTCRTRSSCAHPTG